MLSYLKFQFQRRLRRWRRLARSWRITSAAYMQRHVWGKWRQLGIIRRLVIVWWGVLILSTAGLWGQIGSLQAYYLAPGPVNGGQFVEGEVGQVKVINPVLPESSLSADISRLIFNGLVQIGPNREVEPDLASSWSVSTDGKNYTFNLRHDAHWHDGVPFTARDVLFTLTAIQNPDTRSPLASSWMGVKAQAKDDYTVIMTLPSPLGSFIYATTVGILPSHSLETSDPSALRVSDFNQHPIGTGPFKLASFRPGDGEIELTANSNYYAGRPRLDGFSFRLFQDYGQLVDAYAKRQVTAISRWRPDDPATKHRLTGLRQYGFGLPDQTDLFFRTTAPLLSDKAVRRALSRVIDRQQIISQALAGNAVPLNEPILPGQLGYFTQRPADDHNLSEADQLLTGGGWVRGAGGIRTKDGQTFKLKLLTANTNNYPQVAAVIKQQLQSLGVGVEVIAVDTANLQQTFIRPRNYDLLLYGINIGADPDVYAYWHSSQSSDPGINLSQYASPAADKALESARIAADPDIRTGKYRTFLQTWNDDNPAIVLYEPNYLYGVNGDVKGITAKRLVDPSDRFYGVQNWTVKTNLTLKAKLQKLTKS